MIKNDYGGKRKMKKKVILISIDGMRPDGLLQCGNPYVDYLRNNASYTLDAKTVFPPVTLPCHMSMFHSVPPERHGTTTNRFAPQVRPIKGLFEQIKAAGGICTMYHGWEPLRNISVPGSLISSEYIHIFSDDETDRLLTERMISYTKKYKPDFVFLYMGETDECGHKFGWMSESYLEYINKAISNVKSVIDTFGDEYTVIITADHGGHDRHHGIDCTEDMTIPMFFVGSEFKPAKELNNVSLLDISPTIADIMGIEAAVEWEGKSVLSL